MDFFSLSKCNKQLSFSHSVKHLRSKQNWETIQDQPEKVKFVLAKASENIICGLVIT